MEEKNEKKGILNSITDFTKKNISIEIDGQTMNADELSKADKETKKYVGKRILLSPIYDFLAYDEFSEIGCGIGILLWLICLPFILLWRLIQILLGL